VPGSHASFCHSFSRRCNRRWRYWFTIPLSSSSCSKILAFCLFVKSLSLWSFCRLQHTLTVSTPLHPFCHSHPSFRFLTLLNQLKQLARSTSVLLWYIAAVLEHDLNKSKNQRCACPKTVRIMHFWVQDFTKQSANGPQRFYRSLTSISVEAADASEDVDAIEAARLWVPFSARQNERSGCNATAWSAPGESLEITKLSAAALVTR
jgi:hypothetical protein